MKFIDILKSLISLLVLFAFLAGIYCYMGGRNELKIARTAHDAGDRQSAVTHYSRAIGWHIPVASYVRESADGILQIAKRHELYGETSSAKYAYNILRASLLSVRSVYTPYEEYIDTCNDNIARLNAESIKSSGDERSLDAIKAAQLDLLTRDKRPDAFWSSVAAVSFLGWVLLAVILIFKLFKNNVVNCNSDVIIIMVLLAMAYVVWLVSLVKA